MKDTYKVKYRAPHKMFFKTIKNVLEDGVTEYFRWVRLEDDTLIHFPLDSEVIFPKERQDVITYQMSKAAGQPIQRT